MLAAAVLLAVFAATAFQVQGVPGPLTVIPWEAAVLLLFFQGIVAARRSAPPLPLGIAAVVLGACLIPRLLWLDALPARAHPEDVLNALWSRYCMQGRAPQIFDVGFYNVPLLRFHFDGLFMQAFGDNLLGAKVSSVARGMVAIVFTWLLARRLAPERDALLAPLVLGFHHVFLHYGRTGGHYIDGAMAMAAPAALAVSALEGGGWPMALVAGSTAGLIVQGYFATRSAPVIGMAILGSAVLWPAGRDRRDALRQLGAFVLGCAVTVLPQVVYYVHHQDKLTTREQDVVGLSPLDLLRPASWPKLRANVATIARYHSFGYDKDSHYGAAAPYLSPFALVLVACGAGGWIARRREMAARALVPWIALAPGVLLFMAEPLARRTLAFLPACAILLAMAPSFLARLVGPPWARGVAIALLAMASIDSLDIAFRRFPKEKPIDLLTATGRYLASAGDAPVELLTIPDFLKKDPHVELFAPRTPAREIRVPADIVPGTIVLSAVHAPLLPDLLKEGGEVSFPFGTSPEWTAGGDLPSTMDVRRAPPANGHLPKALPDARERGATITLYGDGDRVLRTSRGPLAFFDYRRVLDPGVRRVRISMMAMGSAEGALRIVLRGRNARARPLVDDRPIDPAALVEIGPAAHRVDVDFYPKVFLDSYQVSVVALSGARCCSAPPP
ncbi:MAG: glycosyltransferase family 39 protein [Acidobacteriota bacterium]